MKRSFFLARRLIQLQCSDKLAYSTGAKAPSIYTKTGDKGTSATYTGERRAKDDVIFEALGATDELSSCIGLAREFCTESDNEVAQRLEEIQCVLQDVGSAIATPRSSARDAHLKKTSFSGDQVTRLEHWIDEYQATLPPLNNFILPSGGRASAQLHVARSVCRKAERRLVPLVRSSQLNSEPAVYLNRLSDFLFMAARHAAFKEGKTERIYRRVESSVD